MEIGFLILFFLAPGLLVNEISRQKNILDNKKEHRPTIYEQLFSAVAHSVIITGMAFCFLQILHRVLHVTFPSKIDILLELFNNVDILCAYVCVILVISFIWEYVFSHHIWTLWFKIKNKKYEEKHNARLANKHGFTILESFFLDSNQVDNENDKKPPLIVSVYKDGIYMTSGILHAWNIGEEDPLEFELIRTMEIEKILEDDKNKPHSEKWLQDIDKEIFIAEHGILIKAYSPDITLQHWDEITF